MRLTLFRRFEPSIALRLTAVIAASLIVALHTPAFAQSAKDTATWLNAIGVRQLPDPYIPNVRFTAGAVAELEYLNFGDADRAKLKPADIAKLAVAKNLAVINATGRKIDDSIAIALAQLRNPILRSIDFGRTSITDATLEALARHPTLTELKAADTTTTATGVAHLATIPNLESLDLNAAVDDAGLATLVGHPTLRTLSIGRTAVTDAGMRHVAAMPKLRYLDISQTAIGDAGLAALQDAPSLAHLMLNRKEGITRKSWAAIARLRKLKSLSLDSSAVHDGIDELHAAPDLQSLNLRYTTLDDTHGPQIGALRYLQELDLHRTKIGDATLVAIATLPTLSTLSVGDTRVTDVGLKALGTAGQKLQKLDLQDTAVTDGGMRYLSSLQALTRIDISDTAVTDTGLIALAKIKTLERVVAERTPGITRNGMRKFKQLRADVDVTR